MSLSNYLSKYTSEDNVSFNEIMADAQRKHREKHAWLFQNEQLQIEVNRNGVFGTTGRETYPYAFFSQDDPDKKKPLMWNYVAKNSLMYVPDGQLSHFDFNLLMLSRTYFKHYR